MFNKICIGCNQNFKSRGSKQIYCSRSCVDKNKIKDRHHSWKGGIKKKYPTKKSNNCIECNIAICKVSIRCIKCDRKNKRNENHHNWQGGISTEKEKQRKRIEYKDWRKSVFERDNYTCKMCNKKGIYLNAHHIKKFSDFPELRFNLDNGITLCKICHKEVNWNEIKYEKLFINKLGVLI